MDAKRLILNIVHFLPILFLAVPLTYPFASKKRATMKSALLLLKFDSKDRTVTPGQKYFPVRYRWNEKQARIRDSNL